MQLNTERIVPQQCTPWSPNSQGLLFVLSAPSGTGKDTVIKTLQEQGMDFYVVSSVTTRRPRQGESEGKPYHFVDTETFKRMVANDELLEYANVHGNWYGQPRKPIRDNLQAGRDVLLKIDVQGAATVRRKVPKEELAQRLDARKTETQEERQRRLEDARIELAKKDWYDYIILNRQGHLEEAVECLRAIMLAEHCRAQPRQIKI
jgi:guanylate kinase